jgi:type II secretory pathway component GspD/PulD (secretin)
MPRLIRIGPITWAAIALSLAWGGMPAAAHAQEGGGPALITLDAEGTPVIDVLKILAARSGLNIVTSPEVQGRTISIHLQNTVFDEALNLIVRAAGLGYERVGHSILVGDVTSLSTQTGLVTRVFDLKYANAEDVRKMLEVICKETSASVRANRILVRGSQSVVEQVADILAQLDVKPAQVVLEARLLEVNATALKELGIDWEKIVKWESVVSEGNPGTSAKGSVPQDLGYIETDKTDDLYRQRTAIEVAVDALLTDGNARLLANSKIVTLDNTPAEIFTGQTVPVVITSLSSGGAGGGVLQTIQLEKIEVGVKLHVTPRVGPDDLITTLVEPEVSTIVAFLGPDSDLPQTSTRRARSLVRVRDGEKIYLGGLLSEETRRTMKKVPLLGDIPILGHLFRHYRDETDRLDLLIEITPRIVGDQGASLPKTPGE